MDGQSLLKRHGTDGPGISKAGGGTSESWATAVASLPITPTIPPTIPPASTLMNWRREVPVPSIRVSRSNRCSSNAFLLCFRGEVRGPACQCPRQEDDLTPLLRDVRPSALTWSNVVIARALSTEVAVDQHSERNRSHR